MLVVALSVTPLVLPPLLVCAYYKKEKRRKQPTTLPSHPPNPPPSNKCNSHLTQNIQNEVLYYTYHIYIYLSNHHSLTSAFMQIIQKTKISLRPISPPLLSHQPITIEMILKTKKHPPSQKKKTRRKNSAESKKRQTTTTFECAGNRQHHHRYCFYRH